MRKALIVWGGWAGHEPEKGARIVEGMLLEDGFEVEVTSDYQALGRPDLRELSLIVPVITSDKIAREPIDNLVAAVRKAADHGPDRLFPRRSTGHDCGHDIVGFFIIDSFE